MHVVLIGRRVSILSEISEFQLQSNYKKIAFDNIALISVCSQIDSVLIQEK